MCLAKKNINLFTQFSEFSNFNPAEPILELEGSAQQV